MVYIYQYIYIYIYISVFGVSIVVYFNEVVFNYFNTMPIWYIYSQLSQSGHLSKADS